VNSHENRRDLAEGMRGMKPLAILSCLMLPAIANAEAYLQPAPRVGAQITVTGIGRTGYCFDSLQHLRLSEVNLWKWSGEYLDSFLASHSIKFLAGAKARVLRASSPYGWDTGYGIDLIQPVKLLVESRGSAGGQNWRGRTCWWELIQNDSSPQFIWWE
jgi:hypothetical protein